jgi:cellulose synthase/poly-beta-1,6-N-acetylglucosamine synthase-like glycosyltransferase
LNTQILLLLVLGFWATRRAKALVHMRDLRSLMQSPLMPPVSVLVPAYNESLNVVQNVRSMLQLRYPQHEVVVINDGSTDDTLRQLVDGFGMYAIARDFDERLPAQPVRAIYESPDYPGLVVVDKQNGGKGDALNAGINLSRYPLFCAIDADSILEEDALVRVARPFHEHPETMVAAGGTVRIANGSDLREGRIVDVRLARGLLPRIQAVEYLRAFLFGRMGWTSLGALLVISGAFGLFEKRAVVDAGGYCTDTVGEDMELVIRLHRTLRESGRPYRIGFVPEPVCWTEAPATLGVLRRQRERWQRGLIDSLWRHRSMIGHGRYGTVGLLAMPAYALFEALSPLIELLGYVIVPIAYALGMLDESFMLAFLSAAVLYAVGVSIGAVLLDDLTFRRYPSLAQMLSLISAGVVEAVAFRPLCAVWRVIAFWKHFRRDRSWGRMERQGIAAA